MPKPRFRLFWKPDWASVRKRATELAKAEEATDKRGKQKMKAVLDVLVSEFDRALVWNGPKGGFIEAIDGIVLRLVFRAIVEGVLAAKDGWKKKPVRKKQARKKPAAKKK